MAKKWKLKQRHDEPEKPIEEPVPTLHDHGFNNREYLEQMRDTYGVLGDYKYVTTAKYTGVGLPWSDFTTAEIEWQLNEHKQELARIELHNRSGGQVGPEVIADINAKIVECENALKGV